MGANSMTSVEILMEGPRNLPAHYFRCARTQRNEHPCHLGLRRQPPAQTATHQSLKPGSVQVSTNSWTSRGKVQQRFLPAQMATRIARTYRDRNRGAAQKRQPPSAAWRSRVSLPFPRFLKSVGRGHYTLITSLCIYGTSLSVGYGAGSTPISWRFQVVVPESPLQHPRLARLIYPLLCDQNLARRQQSLCLMPALGKPPFHQKEIDALLRHSCSNISCSARYQSSSGDPPWRPRLSQ